MDLATELWNSLSTPLPKEDLAGPIMPRPRNPAMPADWAQNLVRGVGGKLADIVMAPRRAMEQGVTTEDIVPWGGDMALALAGAGVPAAARGALGAAGGRLVQPQGIRAYHGSPYDFERFDASKIGTGEGAQSYGHGLYFAENEGVAKAYRDQLAHQNINAGGKSLFADKGWMSPQAKFAGTSTLERMQSQGLTGDDAVRAGVASLHDQMMLTKSDTARRGYQDAANALHELFGKPWEAGKGKMYEVNINAKPEQMLDYDKPLAQQPGLLQGPLKGLDINPEMTGKEVRNFMFRKAREDMKSSGGRLEGSMHSQAASEALREAGIPGIKYLDQGSRSKESIETELAGFKRLAAENPADKTMQWAIRDATDRLKNFKETSNYVLFDDKLIDILRKYAIPGMAPAAGAAGTHGGSAPSEQ